MIVQPTNLAALTWAGAAAGTLGESWRVGSVLAGRLLDRTPQGRMVMQIGGMTVEADAAENQAPPQQFQVRVLTGGAQPLLEILSAPSDSPLVGALRERLPRQGSFPSVLGDLAALGKSAGARLLPPSVRTALALLETSIREPAELATPAGLREAVAKSGLYLEHTLLDASRRPLSPQTSAALLDDWKAALSRLSTLLARMPRGTPTAAGGPRDDVAPPLRHRLPQPQARMVVPLPLVEDADPMVLLGRMRKHVDAALARIEIAQIEAHPSASPNAWMVEIPVRGHQGNDVLQLKISHEGEPDAPNASAGNWVIGFAIDLPALGPLQGEVTLRGNAVSVRLWSERESSIQALEAQMSAIARRLEANGLRLAQLQCRHGAPQGSGGLGPQLVEASA